VALFTAPTAFRAIRKEDPTANSSVSMTSQIPHAVSRR